MAPYSCNLRGAAWSSLTYNKAFINTLSTLVSIIPCLVTLGPTSTSKGENINREPPKLGSAGAPPLGMGGVANP